MALREGLQKIIDSPNKTLIAFCFSFILGAGIFSWFDFAAGAGATFAWYLYIALFFVAALVILKWRHRYCFIILLAFFFLFGAWRFLVTIPDCRDTGNICSHIGETLIVRGRIVAEPDRRIEATYYTVALADYAGRVLVKNRNYPAFDYGDSLQFTCPLSPTRQNSRFRYDKYLARQGIWSTCAGARDIIRIPGLPRSGLTRGREIIFGTIFRIKSRVAEKIGILFAEPESSFVAGILYGSRAGLPREVAENFNRTGLTHIIAVSGYNITIIATALMSTLVFIGCWRRQAYWAVLFAVIVFVIFTGLSPSAVRAATMGIVVLTGQYLGRMSRLGTALVFTAAVMLFLNAYVLLWDAGFQLSFLATLGLVYLSPLISRVLTRISPAAVTGLIGEPLVATVSAIIATLPLVLYQFGRLSLVAPLVNVLVLWIIPLLMLMSFIAVVVSFIVPALGRAVAFLATLGLKYVILLADFFGSAKWSAVDFYLPWWGMVGAYIVMIWYVQKKSKISPIR